MMPVLCLQNVLFLFFVICDMFLVFLNRFTFVCLDGLLTWLDSGPAFSLNVGPPRTQWKPPVFEGRWLERCEPTSRKKKTPMLIDEPWKVVFQNHHKADLGRGCIFLSFTHDSIRDNLI